MPDTKYLDNQKPRKLGDPQCSIKGCQVPVFMIIELRSGDKKLACYGHSNQLAQQYMLTDDCLMVIP